MANIEIEFRTHILGDSTVTGYISTRLYYIKAPQEVVYPYAVYTVVSDPDNRIFVGKDAGQPRFQVDVVSNTLAEAVSIEEAIRSRVSEYTGTLGDKQVIRIEPVARRDISDLLDHSEIQRDYVVEYIR